MKDYERLQQHLFYSVLGQVVRTCGAVGGLRKRTRHLRFCAAAAWKNCSRTNFSRRRRRRRSPI